MDKEKGALENLVAAFMLPDKETFLEFGTAVGKLYTDHGLPLDMAMDKVKERGYSELQQLLIVQGACGWFVEHKRLSGAPEKAIERQRGVNRNILTNFVKGKETGIY